eukprot:590890-Prymnesium_polylepis.1
MPNNDPLNLGHPATDQWARLLAPDRDVTGVKAKLGLGGRRTYEKRGQPPAFSYPMGVRGDDTFLAAAADVSPERILPPRNVRLRMRAAQT